MNPNCLHINNLSAANTMPVELIKFHNIKSKYFLNEDILLEYVLDSEVQPSYRDWIGLYPRGWNNLLQYITFEWIVSRPCEVALRRNILFRSRYHSQVVRSDREYQFLYINKQIEVLGRSQYFRFLPSDARKNVHRIASEKSLTSNISLNSHSLSQMLMSPRMYRPTAFTLDDQQMQVCTQQRQMYPRTINSELSLTGSDVPSIFHLNSQNRLTTCTFCKRPADLIHIQQTFDNKVKSSEERIRNLEDRIQDLENDLEMSQVAQKRLKLAAHHSKRERMAYQKFVNELLYALSQKGVVRVIDGQGTEMLVKRVLSTGTRTDVVEERPSQNVAKTSHRERLLKAVIGSQEQTIRDLLVRLDSTSKVCCNLVMKMDLVSADQNNLDDDIQELSKTMEPMKDFPQSLIAVVPHGQGDTILDVPESEKSSKPDAVLINESVNGDESFISADNSIRFKHKLPAHDETRSSCCDKEQMLIDITDEAAVRPEVSDDSSEPVNEKPFLDDTTKTKAPEKPSALVLEGESMKLAIIRY